MRKVFRKLHYFLLLLSCLIKAVFYGSNKKKITAPASNFCINIADLLKKYGYLANYSVSEGDKREISLELTYVDNQPKISDIKIFSKPGRRWYQKATSLPWGDSKQSLIIISTSKGLLSCPQAVKQNIGGEIIAQIN